MDIDNESNCVLRLVINDLSPSYLDNTIWSNLYTVDEATIETIEEENVSIDSD